MEFAGCTQTVSYRKEPRDGQREVIDRIRKLRRGTLNCQLPTGYGKTFTAMAGYSELHEAGEVDRLLYIVPRTGQLNQFLDDAADNFADVGLTGPQHVWDIGYSPTQALQAHRKNKAQVFVCTIQALATSPAVWEVVTTMIAESRWMIVIDEYQHYGNEAAWGKKAVSLPCVFRLAMSATPYRKEKDSAFGEPDIRVAYRAAVKEGAAKKLICHSYVYRIDVEMPDQTVKSYTTDELVQEAGGDSPDALDKLHQMHIDRSMRWSPKYVSPLVTIPINRAMRERLISGFPQQILIGAMCCSHAELVCQQVRAMYPELRIDWVGTGDWGRTDAQNDEALRRFVPPKKGGTRSPDDVDLDILVHVGMAGEGLDAIFVTEVIHLNRAGINNSNNQENGRGSRPIPGGPANQVCFINVDSSSPYAKYKGEAVMDLMDSLETTKPREEDELPFDDGDENGDNDDDPTWDVLPDKPKIRIYDMECIRVDEGEVQRYKQAVVHAAAVEAAMSNGRPEDIDTPEKLQGLMSTILDDPEHPIHQHAERLYRNFKRREAEEFNAVSVHKQWMQAVDQARHDVKAKVLASLNGRSGGRQDTVLAGVVLKCLNRRLMDLFGRVDKKADIANLERHYQGYVALGAEIIETGVPNWLSQSIEQERRRSDGYRRPGTDFGARYPR